jgi:hypothetical protein
MHIQSLRLRVTEADVTALLARFPPESGAIENLRVRLTADGVSVQGDYPALMMKVSFETVWELAAAGPALAVRLAQVKVAGLPAGVLRGVLLRMVRDAAAKEAGVRVEGETVHVDLEASLKARGVPLTVRLVAVRSGDGWLTVEADEAAATNGPASP